MILRRHLIKKSGCILVDEEGQYWKTWWNGIINELVATNLRSIVTTKASMIKAVNAFDIKDLGAIATNKDSLIESVSNYIENSKLKSVDDIKEGMVLEQYDSKGKLKDAFLLLKICGNTYHFLKKNGETFNSTKDRMELEGYVNLTVKKYGLHYQLTL